MKTISLSEFEKMAQDVADTFTDLNNFYVQVIKWRDNEHPTFNVTFYFNNTNVSGYKKNPIAAIEEAVAMYKQEIDKNQTEVVITY